MEIKDLLKACLFGAVIFFSLWFAINAYTEFRIGMLRGRLNLPTYGTPTAEELSIKEQQNGLITIAFAISLLVVYHDYRERLRERHIGPAKERLPQ